MTVGVTPNQRVKDFLLNENSEVEFAGDQRAGSFLLMTSEVLPIRLPE